MKALVYSAQRSGQRGFLAYLITFIFLLSLSSTYAQTIRYVQPIPMGSRDGSSWANATNDLQAAINSLPVTGGQVWIASGRYKPTTLTGPDSRTISFELKSGVAIYGGFTGNEANLSDRAVSRPSSTTLSGNIGDEASTADNSNYVLHSLNVDSTGVLDGLVITGGGGGLFAERSNYQINNCYFIANTVGMVSSVYPICYPCTPHKSTFRITNCVFQSNIVGVSTDAGQYCFNYFTVINSIFDNNGPGNYGSALSLARVSIDLINCTLRNNRSGSGGGNGGAIGVLEIGMPYSTINVLNCIFFGNRDPYDARFNNFYGGPSTFRYSLIDQTVYGVDSTDIVTTTSPFVSENSDQLTACAPAVDAGNPTSTATTVGAVDLAGNSRFVRRIDMGAYEYQGALCVLANGYMYSLQAGRWDDPATWSEGHVPTSTDRVLLKHAVTIPQNYLAYVLKLKFDISARLIYESGGRLSVDLLQR
jgi:hypothetical protein